MANKFQVKRTTTSGRTPNTTNSGNTMYIDAGELALNLADGKLFTSNGAGLVEFGTGTPIYDSTGTLLTNSYMTYVSMGALATNVVPATDNLLTLGQISYRFAAGYFTNIYVGNTSVNTTITPSNITTKTANIVYSGASPGYPLTISSADAQGGTGYGDFLKVINTSTGASSNTKSFRLTSAGTLEIINSAYTAAILGLTDSGNFSTSGTITPGAYTAGQVIKDTMLSNSEITIVSTTIATSGTSTNFITYNYTPVSSSSYLIVHVHISKYTMAGTTDDSWYSQLKVDGSEIAYGWQMVNDDGTGTSGRSGTLFPLTGRFTNSNTAVKQIQVAARRDTADDSVSIDSSSTAIWLRITEVAR